jgi:AcrR family transcriptional regulator
MQRPVPRPATRVPVDAALAIWLTDRVLNGCGDDRMSDGSMSTQEWATEAESTRERVFRVATELFARSGYDATGVQEISEHAGVGRGALYHHIKSKEQLLYEITMSLMRPVNERAREIVSSDGTALEQLRALARDLLRHLAEDRPAWTVTFRESRALSAGHNADILAEREAYEDCWRRVLARGHEEGVFREVEPSLRRGIIGFFNSTYLWIDAFGSVTPTDLADSYVDLLLHGLSSK